MDNDTEKSMTSKAPRNQDFLQTIVKLICWQDFFLFLFSFNLGAVFVCWAIDAIDFNANFHLGNVMTIGGMGMLFVASKFLDSHNSAEH